jgi:hypothetical protein
MPSLVKVGRPSNFDKKVRLRDHIMWAEFVDSIDEFDEFLRRLDIDGWYTIQN